LQNHSEHHSYASFPVFRSLDLNRKSPLDKFLGLFADVRGGEGVGVLLLFANILTLLASYYLLKTVREALILSEGGAVVKSYASAGQALLLLLIIPFYSALASRTRRARLLSGVSLFFAVNLVIFYALALSGVKLGVAFFLWVGIFNVFVISQFWAFANDLYTEPQGKRLFPIIGVGSALGALAGAEAASILVKRWGPFPEMLIAAALLLLCALLTVVADRRVSARLGEAQQAASQKPLAAGDGFALVFQDRYLILIAALTVILNVVNTSGEFLLSRFVVEQANAAIGAGDAFKEARSRFIGSFYGDFFSWVNFLGLALQSFLVSRLFRYVGVRGALFILPSIAFTGYVFLLAAPVLGVIKVLKILENSTDYSIQNTARQALFLPTSREAKYKAKAAIDTFFQRAGDVIQAFIVFLGTQAGLGVTGFAMVNLLLTGVWLIVVAALYLEHRRRTTALPQPISAPGD